MKRTRSKKGLDVGEEFERKLERNKDIAQEAVEVTANRVGRITTIITGAVSDVAREVGDMITDGFEMRDAARRAKADANRSLEVDGTLDEAEDSDAALPPAQTNPELDIIDAEIADGDLDSH